MFSFLLKPGMVKCVDNSSAREAEMGGVLVFNTHPVFLFFFFYLLHSRPERTIASKERLLVPEERNPRLTWASREYVDRPFHGLLSLGPFPRWLLTEPCLHKST